MRTILQLATVFACASTSLGFIVLPIKNQPPYPTVNFVVEQSADAKAGAGHLRAERASQTARSLAAAGARNDVEQQQAAILAAANAL